MKTKRIVVIAAAVTGTVLIAAATFFVASAPPAHAARDEGRYDRFPISVEALDARRAEVFANVDTDGDGLISAEEFAAAEMPKRPRGGHHKRGGWHGGSGEPTEEMIAERSEAMAGMEEELFHALDADADGVVSRDEFSREAMHEAKKASMKSRLFERADADGDGYLSPDEFPPRRLANLDANGDGKITRDELPERTGRHPWGRSAS